MKDVFLFSAVGMFAGVAGTGLGGAIASIGRYDGSGFLSRVLEFSAGLMISIVCFDLLPHAFSSAPLPLVFSGVILGAVCMMVFSLREDEFMAESGKNGLVSVGMRLAAGVALHNFPEGLAIGSGFQGGSALGLSLAAAIMLHNIPEGMALSSPLMAGGLSPFRAARTAAISGIPMGVGAFAGAVAGGVSPPVLAFFLSLAGGAMLFLSFGDILPEAKRGGSGHPLICLLGVLIGILIVRIMG